MADDSYITRMRETNTATQTRNETMTIEFNGSTTYMVMDADGTCLFATDTKRKAQNFLNRFLKDSGLAG